MKGETMRRLLAIPLVAVVALLAAGASNAGREQQVLTCGTYGTLTVTVTTTKNDHSVAWGTGKVSSPRLLGIPVSFSGTTTDLTTGKTLDTFHQVKGKGHGMHRRATVQCTAPAQTGTAAQLGITGVNPTDTIEFDFTAQVVIKQHR
jgi:hypothetical protein